MEKCKSLAMAEVPWQKFTQVMNGDQGLEHGTIFKELVMPFYGVKAACNLQFNEGRRCDCR